MEDMKTCQRRALECARQAVYAKDAKKRRAYTQAAEWWFKRAQEIRHPKSVPSDVSQFLPPMARSQPVMNKGLTK